MAPFPNHGVGETGPSTKGSPAGRRGHDPNRRRRRRRAPPAGGTEGRPRAALARPAHATAGGVGEPETSPPPGKTLFRRPGSESARRGRQGRDGRSSPAAERCRRPGVRVTDFLESGAAVRFAPNKMARLCRSQVPLPRRPGPSPIEERGGKVGHGAPSRRRAQDPAARRPRTESCTTSRASTVTEDS